MPVQDLTEDPRIGMQIASDIGSTISGIMTSYSQRKQLDETKQKKQFQQAYTTRLLQGDLKGQDLLNAFNEMPGAVDSEMGQRFQQQQLQNRISGDTNRDVDNLRKLTKDYQSLFQWDNVQGEFIPKPGSELLRNGYETGIKNTSKKISDAIELEKQQKQVATQGQQATAQVQQADDSIQPALNKEQLRLQSKIDKIKKMLNKKVSPRNRASMERFLAKTEKRLADSLGGIAAVKQDVKQEQPTEQELRSAGTEEAYKIGVKLGYWQ